MQSEKIKCLLSQHREIEEKLTELDEPLQADDARSKSVQLREFVLLHIKMEEEVFKEANFPVTAVHEHLSALFEELASMDPCHTSWCNLVSDLSLLVKNHIKKEESIIFPKLESH